MIDGVWGDISIDMGFAIRDAILDNIGDWDIEWSKRDKRSKSKDGETSSSESDSREATDPPLGSDGPTIPSQEVGSGPEGRIDVENPNPGQRPGQIHFQEPGSKIHWIYDLVRKVFYNQDTGALAPPRIQKLLNEPWVQQAIAKGIYYLSGGQ